MNRWSALALAGAVVLAGCDDSADAPLAPSFAAASAGVTTSADAGPGSLRAAIDAAELDPSITRIQLATGLGVITLVTPLEFTGSQALAIHGSGAELDASDLPAGTLAAFLVDGAAGFSASDLTISGSPGTGLTVKVPAGSTGIFTVGLDRFTAANNTLHGVIINDQTFYFDDHASTSSDGSAASLQVRVSASRFEGNGFGDADQDGFRVNEGGEGTLDFVVRGSTFEGNGADGLELDERGAGDAVFTVQESALPGNGTKVNDPIDFDDGMDVDEVGDGSLIGRIIQSTANDNAEEGFDLNENDAGDFRLEMNQVEASGNAEEGVDLEEDDEFEATASGGGNLVTDLRNVVTRGNGSVGGDAGLKLRERGDGGILGRIVGAVATDNLIDGIQIREQEDGVVDAQLVSSTASDNDNDGLRLRGEGQVRLQSVTNEGNGDDDLQQDATIVVTAVP